MHSSLSTILAGSAILAAAAATPALAGDGPVHVMTIHLPGGGVEQIRYTGDVPPNVVLVPQPSMMAAPIMMMPMTAPDPFATLERITALMDQQAAAMLRQATMMPATALPDLSPGTSGYSFIATMSDNGVCTQTMRITYAGGDTRPRMVSGMSGDCGSNSGTQKPTEVEMPAPSPQRHVPSGVIEARAPTPRPDPLRQVAWRQ